jgi:hypothetical protein
MLRKWIISRKLGYEINVLEIVITDFCNLECKLCAQGTPYVKDKQVLSLHRIRELSEYFKLQKFRTIKISGGEPTLHPEFAQLCAEIKSLFSAEHYVLATNGYLLEKYLNEIKVFDTIDLTEYPGHNSQVYERLCALNIPGLHACVRHEYVELMDIFSTKNAHKKNIFRNCVFSYPGGHVKIVQDRIYPCCVVFGLSQVRQGIACDNISVKLDKDWKRNLSKLDIEEYCRMCFFDVKNQKSKIYFFLEDLKKLVTRVWRWCKKITTQNAGKM